LPPTRTSPSCLYRLLKRFELCQWLLSRRPYCCWDPAPGVQPAHLGTVYGVLLRTWTLRPTWQRGRRCGSQSDSHASTACFRHSSRHWCLHLPSSRYFILSRIRMGQCCQ
jgi:hypothetical protein